MTLTIQFAAVMDDAAPGGDAVLLEMDGRELLVISRMVLVLSALTCITTVAPDGTRMLAWIEMRSPATYPSSAVLHSR